MNVRNVLLGFAALSTLAGLWILCPSLLAGGHTGGHRAEVAARIALVRSDIWAQISSKTDAQNLGANDRASQGAAIAAVTLSPLRPAQWIEIAGSQPSVQESAVTMALFTGPGRRDLVDRRLQAAGRIADLAKSDLCDMLRSDVRFRLGQPPSASRLAGLPSSGMECFQKLAAEVTP